MAQMDWKESLKSETAFNSFINDYFKDHKQLTGKYETRSYYEHYTVTLNSKKGLIITLVSSVNPTFSSDAPTVPVKDVETISIEEFRQLILNKKFADMHTSLADVFQAVAGVPDEKK